MSQKIKITIPTPCHENWQMMSPTEKGRFCDSCQKNVFDFTKASDRQIISAYNTNPNLCGRFINTQLDRDLIAPKEKSSIWMATTSALISFLALGNQEITAQETVKTEQTDQRHFLGKPARTFENQEREITGIVVDESNQPIPGVTVVVKGTSKNTSAGFEGEFKIQANEGETLIFSFMGMGEETIVVEKSNFYRVKMDDNVRLQGEVVFVKPSFFKRVTYSIRNLFR